MLLNNYNSNMKDFLNTFYKLDQSGIVIINGTIYNSSNLISTLKRIKASNIRILELGGCPIIRSIRAGYYRYALGLKGHCFPWKVSIHIRVYLIKKERDMEHYKAFVVGKNAYQEIVLGIFNKKIEAKEFITSYYPLGIINSIVLSSNELTKYYYEDN